MNKDMKFTMVNAEGVEGECETLFTFKSEETNKDYIIFTDNTFDETGNIKVYANIYNPNGEDMNLQPIETEEEFEIVQNILSTLQEQALNERDGEMNGKSKDEAGDEAVITLKEILDEE